MEYLEWFDKFTTSGSFRLRFNSTPLRVKIHIVSDVEGENGWSPKESTHSLCVSVKKCRRKLERGYFVQKVEVP